MRGWWVDEEVAVSGKGLVWRAVSGAAAGAAGTTALNAVTYVDMAARGRPASKTPYRTVEHLAKRVGLSVHGDRRSQRLSAAGDLGGLVTGVVMGAGLGIARAAYRPQGLVAGGLIGAAVAMAGANGPMVAMHVTDPRDWSAADWLADLVPHLAYGLVTAWVLDALDS